MQALEVIITVSFISYQKGSSSEPNKLPLDPPLAEGCSLSPILFSVIISDLLEEIDGAQIGIQPKSGNKVGGLLFADYFLGSTESSENLQQLLDIIYEFCSKWRLHANVNKSAVLVFGKTKLKVSAIKVITFSQLLASILI